MGRLAATRWLERLDAAREACLRGEAEGVHQVRVVARRLRVWVRLAKQPALDDELRWLIHELGLLRDLDVLGETLTAAARAQLRGPAIARAVSALESERYRTLRASLAAAKAPRRRRARKLVARLEARLAGTQLTAETEALHRLRRKLRTLRYAREWLGLDAAALAEDQQWLGSLCDLFALERLAKQLI